DPSMSGRQRLRLATGDLCRLPLAPNVELMTVDVEQHPREAGRDVARPRSWTPFGVVIVLFLMAILAASVAGHPRIAASREAPGPLPLPQVEPTRIPTTSPSSLDTGDGELALLIIGIVLAVLVS